LRWTPAGQMYEPRAYSTRWPRSILVRQNGRTCQSTPSAAAPTGLWQI